MATITRQPFAPLDGSRLQNLTSLKNRQNAIATPAGKRKVESVDTDDSENVDPVFFAKRSKGSGGNAFSSAKDSFVKPTNYFFTTAKKPLSSTTFHTPAAAPNAITKPTPRRMMQPKSPAAKLNTSIAKASPLSAPAGRSPTRGKRSGILSTRRRTAGSYTRVDPPSFNLGLETLSSSASPAPFSLDAALKGSIPSYAAKRTLDDALEETDTKASWYFDIHEDTQEQEMTNMLQHGTCVLDISSDEESERKAKRDSYEDKENVPPMDDVSQTSRRQERAARDEMIVEKERVSLGELNRSDFYAEGCNESSVIFIPSDDEENAERAQHKNQLASATKEARAPIVEDFNFAPRLRDLEPTLVPLPDLDAGLESDAETEIDVPIHADIDVLMSKVEDTSSKAAVLQPMDGTGDSFELWESGSSKGDGDGVAADVS